MRISTRSWSARATGFGRDSRSAPWARPATPAIHGSCRICIWRWLRGVRALIRPVSASSWRRRTPVRDIPPTHAGASDGGMTRSADGIQWVQGLGGSRIEAGTTERGLAREALIARWRHTRLAEVQQVHGGAVAALLGQAVPHAPIAGCDALVTTVPALALVIRTADCLPVFFADAARGVIGLAHVGWRGVAAELPARVVAFFRHGFFSAPQGLRATIGPCIRACCYDVGPEFTPPHGSPARECGEEGESPKPWALAR